MCELFLFIWSPKVVCWQVLECDFFFVFFFASEQNVFLTDDSQDYIGWPFTSKFNIFKLSNEQIIAVTDSQGHTYVLVDPWFINEMYSLQCWSLLSHFAKSASFYWYSYKNFKGCSCHNYTSFQEGEGAKCQLRHGKRTLLFLKLTYFWTEYVKCTATWRSI